MTITIDYTPENKELIERQAIANNTTAEEFIRDASLKAARNAEYLAELDRRSKDIAEGKNIISFTDKEWEAFINAQNIQ